MPDYRPFPDNAKYASVHLYGPQTGDVWFDDLKFIDINSGKNLLPFGNFEQEIDELDVELDFSAFDKAAHKYLDQFGFSGFRFGVPGLAKKQHGELNGFVSGTSEYKKLMELYLKGVQDHLEANGWLGKEYLYWADEPDHEHYKFVREGMDIIHEVAPKLTRFIIEKPSKIITDRWIGYNGLSQIGYEHEIQESKVKDGDEEILPNVHRIPSLLKDSCLVHIRTGYYLTL